MKHKATEEFWALYDRLPDPIRRTADKNFALLRDAPHHPSLRLKRAGRFWSVRVGRGYRALGLDQPGEIAWVWIGSHAEYDRLVGG